MVPVVYGKRDHVLSVTIIVCSPFLLLSTHLNRTRELAPNHESGSAQGRPGLFFSVELFGFDLICLIR